MSAISSVTTQATNNVPPNNLVASNAKANDSENNSEMIMIIATGALTAVALFFLLLAGGIAFSASLTVSVISGGLMSLAAYLTLQQPAPRPNPPSPDVLNKILKDEESNRINQLNSEFQDVKRNLPTSVQTIQKSLDLHEKKYEKQLENLEKETKENKAETRESLKREFRESIIDALKLIYILVKTRKEVESVLSSFKDKYPDEVDAVLLENTL